MVRGEEDVEMALPFTTAARMNLPKVACTACEMPW
jgi:hypothetical protein